jgi:ammonium transporter, Amt family
VSGAVAERIKLSSFLIFALLFVAISYPITGSWQWGEGWLNQLGFHDFAGSTLVHAVGGWGALAGAIILGPRLSVLSADPGQTSLVRVNTCLAAAAGAMGAMMTAWSVLKKPDFSIMLNGVLAGLVGITAGADLMWPLTAVVIGLLSGMLVVASIIFLDKIRVDDPVGAILVHLVCGVWGTLAVGILGQKAGWEQLKHQLVGTFSIGLFTFFFALAAFLLVKSSTGLRVSPEEEIEGLDIGEHGNEAYADLSPSLRNNPVLT